MAFDPNKAAEPEAAKAPASEARFGLILSYELRRDFCLIVV